MKVFADARRGRAGPKAKSGTGDIAKVSGGEYTLPLKNTTFQLFGGTMGYMSVKD